MQKVGRFFRGILAASLFLALVAGCKPQSGSESGQSDSGAPGVIVHEETLEDYMVAQKVNEAFRVSLGIGGGDAPSLPASAGSASGLTIVAFEPSVGASAKSDGETRVEGQLRVEVKPSSASHLQNPCQTFMTLGATRYGLITPILKFDDGSSGRFDAAVAGELLRIPVIIRLPADAAQAGSVRVSLVRVYRNCPDASASGGVDVAFTALDLPL